VSKHLEHVRRNPLCPHFRHIGRPGAANVATNRQLNPVSKTPEFRIPACRMTKVGVGQVAVA